MCNIKTCRNCRLLNRKTGKCVWVSKPQKPLLGKGEEGEECNNYSGGCSGYICSGWDLYVNGIYIIEVLDGRKKLVIRPGFGATPEDIRFVLDWCKANNTIIREVTLRDTNLDDIRKYSESGKYSGATRDVLVDSLTELGFKKSYIDNNIFIKEYTILTQICLDYDRSTVLFAKVPVKNGNIVKCDIPFIDSLFACRIMKEFEYKGNKCNKGNKGNKGKHIFSLSNKENGRENNPESINFEPIIDIVIVPVPEEEYTCAVFEQCSEIRESFKQYVAMQQVKSSPIKSATFLSQNDIICAIDMTGSNIRENICVYILPYAVVKRQKIQESKKTTSL